MDPLSALALQTDTTLLLAREAQRRGHILWHYTPDMLSWRDGDITASAQRLTMGKIPSLGTPETIDIETMDVVLIRQNPPFDMSYLTATYLLEKLHPNPLVVNHPTAVRDYPEKLFPLEFKRFMPPTLISADIDEIKRFRKQHKDIVLKPLYGHGGREVFRLKPDDHNFSALMETLFAGSKEPRMVQRYLPEMRTKEHRIVLIDGEFAATAARIPPKGETRASVPLGAKYVKAKLTRREQEICQALKPWMKQEGIVLAGVDVIGDWLTEINITSPAGLVPLNKLYDLRMERDFWDAVESYL